MAKKLKRFEVVEPTEAYISTVGLLTLARDCEQYGWTNEEFQELATLRKDETYAAAGLKIKRVE